MSKILTANNITKVFPENNQTILKGVSLSVEEGDFISILGASGSGKTTLLSLLGGMDKATSGEIRFEGSELGKMKEKDLAALRRTKIGFVFQFFNLAPYLTVKENILLPLILDGKNLKTYDKKYRELIKYFNIEHIESKLPRYLSGGEQQRVAIARSLIYSPKIIFLDEPTGNLDSGNALEIMNLLARINQETGTTVLQVTHNEQNTTFGNRVLRIVDGKIVEESAEEKE